jgi:transcription elongation factor Elf1
MGRRKRKVVKIIRRTLPKIFLCPKCGKQSVSVKVDNKGQLAHVVCGSCGAATDVPKLPHEQPVDLYCKFTDKFYAGEL